MVFNILKKNLRHMEIQTVKLFIMKKLKHKNNKNSKIKKQNKND